MVFAIGAAPVFAQVSTTVDQVVYDHIGAPFRTSGGFGAPWGAHEAGLHGVPSSYDWAAGAKPNLWMNRGSNSALSSWGQVYEVIEGSPEKNVRVQVRNYVLYGLVNGSWQVLEQGNDLAGIGGNNFTEDFTGGGRYSDVRGEASGGISFTMTPGYNFHFWINRWPRTTIPAGLTAFYTHCEMRLIPNTNPNVNLSNAKYVAGISNDYYPNATSAGFGPWPSITISRHKYITPEWKTFSSYVGGPVPTSVEHYRNFILSNPLPPGVTLAGAASAPNPSPMPAPAPETTPIQTPGSFSEDFNDNIAQNFMLSTNMVVTGGKMSSTNWLPSSLAIYDGQAFDAYIYKVDKASAGGSLGNLDRILFNYVNANNYYFVEFSGGASGTATLKKRAGGVVSTLASYGAYATSGRLVKVEVSYAAGKITVKAAKDGMQTTLFNSVSDSSLASGKVGVSANYNNVDYDNFNVSSIAPLESMAEDFSDNIAHDFALSANMSVAGGKLYSTNWTDFSQAVYNGHTFSTFNYKVNKFSAGDHPANIDQILFNYVDANNYHFVEFSGGASGKVILKKKVGGVVTILANYGIYATSRQLVTIEVIRTATQITVKATKAGVQTTLFDSVSDPSMTLGKIGVSTNYNNVDYDNFKVN